MNPYQRMGRWIGGHMPILAPVCVVVGILLADVFQPLKPFVPALFAVMSFQGSLSNRFAQVGRVFARPLVLLVVLVLTQFVFPVVAYLAASVFFPDVDIVTGIVLEYCVPVAVVSFMWTEMYDGNSPLTLAIVLVTTVLAPFTIPALLMFLLGAQIEIDVVSMMVQMLYMIAIPAVAGMVVNDATRGWGKTVLAPAIQPATRTLLLVIITTNASSMAPYMERFDLETVGIMVFMFIYSALGFAAGIAVARLMKRDAATAVSMCFTCGMKNISAGAVIASAFFPPATVFPVMMGTLFQEVLAGLSGKWLESRGKLQK